MSLLITVLVTFFAGMGAGLGFYFSGLFCQVRLIPISPFEWMLRFRKAPFQSPHIHDQYEKFV